jgi:hypothetical protein
MYFSSSQVDEFSDCWMKLVRCWVWGRLIYFVVFLHEAGTVRPDVGYVLCSAEAEADADAVLSPRNEWLPLVLVRLTCSEIQVGACLAKRGERFLSLAGLKRDAILLTGFSSSEVRAGVPRGFSCRFFSGSSLGCSAAVQGRGAITIATKATSVKQMNDLTNLNPPYTNECMGLFRSCDRLHSPSFMMTTVYHTNNIQSVRYLLPVYVPFSN